MGLYVIEDNAQAIGCDYIFSDGTRKKTEPSVISGPLLFILPKILGAFGDGGAISTNDQELATKLKMIANHGQQKKYYHEMIGCNSRLDSIQAVILDIKLKHLDEYIAARRQAAAYYDKAFAGDDKITTPYRAPWSTHAFHQYTLVLKASTAMDCINSLPSRKIPSMIYYPVPGHQQKMFEKFNTSKQLMPITDG